MGDRRGWKGAGEFAALVVALLAVRGLLVIALADVFFYGEELEKGTAAKALLDGVRWSHHELAYHPYEGGGFLISHLKALAFRVVGENVLAHKCVALLFGVAVLWAGWRLARRHFGDRAGTLFGALFVLAPASLQQLSLLNLGIHFEASLFILLAMDATLALLRRGREPSNEARGSDVVDVAVLGVTLGFGVFFNYQVALVALWSSVWLLLRRPRLYMGRTLVVGLGSFLLGLAPLGYMAWHVGRGVLDIHGTPLTTVQSNGAKVEAFLRSLYEGRPFLEWFPAAIYAAAFVFAVIVLVTRAWRARSTRARAGLVLGSYFALWIAVYLASGFVVGAVVHPFLLLRFAPLLVLALLLMAAALTREADAGSFSPQSAAFAALLVLGAIGTGRILAAGQLERWHANWATLNSVKGYDYAGYFAKVLPRLKDYDREWALSDFEEPDEGLLVADYAQAISEHGPRDVTAFFEAWRTEQPERFEQLVRGAGAAIARKGGHDIVRILELVLAGPDEVQGPALEAVGRFGTAYAQFPRQVASELDRAAEVFTSEEAHASYLRGVGQRLWRRFVHGPYGTVRFHLKPGEMRRWIGLRPEFERSYMLEGFENAAEEHQL